MSDQSQHSNGADIEQPSSLRDIAEAAYESVTGGDDSEIEPGGQPRDEHGRWVSKSTEGEAAATPPSPSEAPQETDEHPAPETGPAAQAPSNWSAEDRDMFAKLPQEGQSFLLRRHSQMESDYQTRIQAAAISNQFVNAVAPVFQDPEIAASMQRDGRTPMEAIYQWGAFHKRAVSPDVGTRIQLLYELADRMQLDPAAVFRAQQQQAPQFTPEELANPAIRKFADQIGFLNSRLAANQQAMQAFQAQQQQAMTAQRRAEIDAFADAKDASGNKLRPHFDAVLPIVMEHFRSNPNMSIEDAYKAAIEPIIGPAEAQARANLEKQQNLDRAKVAVRGNVRGGTAPVDRPKAKDGPRSLRSVIDEAADEIGFTA